MALFDCLILVFAQKGLRYRAGKAQRRNCFGGDGALRAFFIHHDADDFDVLRHIDLFQHVLAIGHLWDGFGRDEANGIDVFESRFD